MANYIQSSAERECIGGQWWMQQFDVTRPQPPRWVARQQLPPPLGRLGRMYVWWRADADRYLEILREQTGTEPRRTTSAERRQAVDAFLADKAARATPELA